MRPIDLHEASSSLEPAPGKLALHQGGSREIAGTGPENVSIEAGQPIHKLIF
jgi:hypothetical protein